VGGGKIFVPGFTETEGGEVLRPPPSKPRAGGRGGRGSTPLGTFAGKNKIFFAAQSAAIFFNLK